MIECCSDGCMQYKKNTNKTLVFHIVSKMKNVQQLVLRHLIKEEEHNDEIIPTLINGKKFYDIYTVRRNKEAFLNLIIKYLIDNDYKFKNYFRLIIFV